MYTLTNGQVVNSNLSSIILDDKCEIEKLWEEIVEIIKMLDDKRSFNNQTI
jgi:hypothetical protein